MRFEDGVIQFDTDFSSVIKIIEAGSNFLLLYWKIKLVELG